jgi:putative isomerase
MPLWAGIAYGYGEEAARLAANLVRMLETDLAAHGCLHEYYDPESGHGLTHPGFLNWNSLAVALSEPDLRAARREDP